MSTETHIILRNDIKQLDQLAAEVEAFAEQAEIGMKASFSLNLVLDEIVTNIISYAYNDDDAHNIDLSLSYDAPHLSAVIVDDGVAFDPSQATDADTDSSIQERQIGGLGLHFVRTFMDCVEYQRIGDQNHLRLDKDLSK